MKYRWVERRVLLQSELQQASHVAAPLQSSYRPSELGSRPDETPFAIIQEWSGAPAMMKHR